ncbi:MAG: riboflavin kinase / FMN adenylyltransferase [Parcubacteria group bacterium Gr01-1014_8]|nr:MAG: riboflavin kinase / FMN adenylyltransferase [Parcubacteria group bacterium Gr01-1014_8]
MKKFSGIVQKGKGYGATLGFPTANIPLEGDFSGVYAAQVRVDGRTYVAAVFANKERKVLEAYLPDFSGDLYGKEISVELREKIRETTQFDTEESLKAAIAGDVAAVKKYFKL